MGMLALSQHLLAPIASLRNINPYVETTLADLAAKGLKTPLPRQASAHAHPDPHAASFGKAIHLSAFPYIEILSCSHIFSWGSS